MPIIAYTFGRKFAGENAVRDAARYEKETGLDKLFQREREKAAAAKQETPETEKPVAPAPQP
jgi:hypothetical protein